MARIGILHRNFNSLGGREAVCLQFLEALSEDHQVALLTAKDVDLEYLNSFFGTSVADVKIEPLSLFGIPAKYFDSLLGRLIADGRLGFFREYRFIMINRAAKSEFDNLDLLVITSHEIDADIPLIQYIHFPKYHRDLNPYVDTPSGPIFSLMSRFLKRFDDSNPLPGFILTNSSWTAGVIEEVYGAKSRVVYPPIQVDKFEHEIPDNRRFVIAGRLHRDKRIDQAIEVMRAVRERGYDIDFEIVGPSFDNDYAREIEDISAKSNFIEVSTDLSFDEYARRLEASRYGIHAKPNEHFGMVIAEMVAAGVLPFVPNDGGQTDIVSGQPNLMYSKTSEAVNKICHILDNPGEERRVRAQLPDVSRYSAEKFKSEVRDVVEELLESLA